MFKRYRHIVIFLLLFSYLIFGAVGYLETLILSGFGTNPQYLTRTGDGPPPTSKVYWTQYKHIPSTIKISVPSPAVFTPSAMPHACFYGIAFTHGVSRILSDPSFSLHSSRAPPQI